MNLKIHARQCTALALAFLVFLCCAGQALCQNSNKGKAGAVSSSTGCISGNCVNGTGNYTEANGNKYVGEWKDGKPHGKGTLTMANGSKYVGEYKDGQHHGQGIYTFPNGDKYVGEFKDGKKHGQGTYTFPNGGKYVGEYKNDQENGKGTLILADGRKYVGEFKDGKHHGQGTYTFANGEKYVGEFKDGKKHGHGTYTFPDGGKYVGEYKDDQENGQGTLVLANGTKYIGEFKDGKPLGQVASGTEQGNPSTSPEALNAFNTAKKLREQGKYSEAIPYAEKALKIYEKENGLNHENVGVCFDLLGLLYQALGNYSAADPLYKRALALFEKALGPDHPNVASSLNNLATLYQVLGNYSAAELLYKRALAIKEKALGPDHPDVATSLNNLASLYQALGNYSAAEPLYKRALAIYEKALGPEHPYVATSLSGLAFLYDTLGNYSAAEQLYKRALAIKEKALGLDHPDVKSSHSNLAFLHVETGRLDEAYKVFKNDTTGMSLGKYYLVKQEFTEAQKQFQTSLKDVLSRDKKLPQWLITDYTGLGLAYEGQGDYKEAKANFQKAIDLNEEQWQTLSVSAKRNFMAGKVGADFKRLEPYEGMVRVLLKEGKAGCEKEALKYAEMVKSRLFLEQLAAKESKGKTSQDTAVLENDRNLQQQVAMLRTRLTKLEELGTRAPAGDVAQVTKEFEKASTEYEKFLNEVKLSGSEVSSLVTVETVAAEDLQKLIDVDTTILEYYTAQDKTYAWVITKSSIKTVEIPRDTKQLADKVNEFRLANISNRSRRPVPVMTLATSEKQAEATEGQRQKNREQYAVLSEEFYKELIAPVAKDLTTPKLIIVPHGSLHKVPFSSLSDGKQYLVDRYAITVLPAASVAKYIGAKRKKETGKLFAVSNPKTEYTPLAFAEEEVKSIGKLFNDKEVYAEEKATESTVKDKAKQAGILHFACHGEFNDMQPLQSGLILAKDGANDGYLQVHEIFSLNLEKANIVALSACETALSRIQGGDDLVGLSRGFIYAGTPSLLASLWQVDDRATGELMEKFYDNWQNKKMAKPEALRQAQLSIKSKPEYSHPFYWAAFEMIGDWQ